MANMTYWIKYPRGFWNEYVLVWEWNDNAPALEKLKNDGFERITRKEAIAKCVQERFARRNFGHGSAYFADAYIWHYSNPVTSDYARLYERDYLDSGYILID